MSNRLSNTYNRQFVQKNNHGYFGEWNQQIEISKGLTDDSSPMGSEYHGYLNGAVEPISDGSENLSQTTTEESVQSNTCRKRLKTQTPIIFLFFDNKDKPKKNTVFTDFIS